MVGMRAAARKTHSEPAAAPSRVPTLAEQLIAFGEANREIAEAARALRRAIPELVKEAEARGFPLLEVAEDAEFVDQINRLLGALNAATQKEGKQKRGVYINDENKLESTYTAVMRGAVTEAVDRLADVLGIPEHRRIDFRITVADFVDAVRETTGRATAAPRLEHAATERTKRGPRVKPNPALPETAPEIYRDRKPRQELGGRKENIVQFIERVYAPWREILSRADLWRLDETAGKALYNCKDGKNLPPGLVPTEFELNTEKRIAATNRRLSKVRHEFASP